MPQPLSDTRPIRAQILYNHIFFSDLPDPYKRALLEGRRYSTILAHPNYNPRIVEHMTQYRNVSHLVANQYFEEFVRSLANPPRIWDHAFRNDLSEAAQHILLTLSSMPTPVLLSDLKTAFDSFYQYRRKKIGFATSSRDFEHALKELDGNFVKTDLVGEDSVIDFHNPSVNDYLDSYLSESPDDVADVFQSAVFFEQFKQLWSGQHEKRFSGLDKYSDGFVGAVSAKFMAPSCRVFRRLSQGRNAFCSTMGTGSQRRPRSADRAVQHQRLGATTGLNALASDRKRFPLIRMLRLSKTGEEKGTARHRTGMIEHR